MTVDANHEFVGAGWNFPVVMDAQGRIGLASGTTEIDQAIYLILATAAGERPMRPEFGSHLHEFIFAPADETTAGLIAFEVRSALTRWEPRIDIVDVTVTIGEDAPSTMWITVNYVIRDNYDRRNLVFPFYTIPLHDAEVGVGS
jgi:hypothetical protein